jgi:hypothetical protein
MGVPGQPKVESFGSAYSNNAGGAVSILSLVIEGRKRPTSFAKGCFIGATLMFQRTPAMNVTPCDWENRDRCLRRRPSRVTFTSGMV